MAKDLPYFKFFCSEWNDGDITLEDYYTQGLFINICSYYWSNECELSYIKLKKKFNNDFNTLDLLIDAGLIKVLDDIISITFLDEQWDERVEQSKIKSKGGLASAEARKLKKLQQESNTTLTENEHVLNSCSTESQLLREDKIREEKKRKDIYTENDFLQRWKDARLYYDKQPTNITKLETYEKVNFNIILQNYKKEDIDKAISGLFFQETYLKTRVRPTHFLELSNFETYLTCWNTKEKLFKKPSKKYNDSI